MGWKIKVFALFLAFVSAAAGVWIVAIPLFFYVIMSTYLSRRKRTPVQVQVRLQQPNQGLIPGGSTSQQQYADFSDSNSWQLPSSSPYVPSTAGNDYSSHGPLSRISLEESLSKRYIVGGILIFLALVALGSGGTYSPIAFGAPGLLLVFWGHISNTREFLSTRKVRESILLRRSIFPVCWYAFAEVKFTTRNVATALSSVNERIIIARSEKKPSVHLIFRGFALTEEGAEDKILYKMEETATTLAPLGAYLLPLDSEQSVASMYFETKALKLDKRNFAHSLFTLPHEIVSIASESGYVESIGASRIGQRWRPDDAAHADALILPSHLLRPKKRPLLWETLRLIEARVRWPNPDEMTSFLSSLCATQGLTPGERIEEASTPTDAKKTISVISLGSPQVELTRVQLRALMRVYARPYSGNY